MRVQAANSDEQLAVRNLGLLCSSWHWWLSYWGFVFSRKS